MPRLLPPMRTAWLLLSVMLTACGAHVHIEPTPAGGYASAFPAPVRWALPKEQMGAVRRFQWTGEAAEMAYRELSWGGMSRLGLERRVLNPHEPQARREGLYWKGIPIEKAEWLSSADGLTEPFLWGSLPPEGDLDPTKWEWGFSERAALEKAQALRPQWSEAHWGVGQKLLAWDAAQGRVRPAWKWVVLSADHAGQNAPMWPIELSLDANSGGILREEAMALEVTEGQGLLYAENRVASQSQGLQWQKLPDLAANGVLAGPLLEVLTCTEGDGQWTAPHVDRCTHKEFNAQARYAHPYSDSLYDAVNAWYAVQRSMAWHRLAMGKRMGETDWGKNFGLKAPLKVFTRVASFEGNVVRLGNAFFMPTGMGENRDQPYIGIGAGCLDASNCHDPLTTGGWSSQTSLVDVGKDSDVVSHELGHLMVYRTLTTFGNNQSGGLHEGYADFFTYAMTGNNLLAESVVQRVPAPNGADLRGLRVGDKAARLEAVFDLANARRKNGQNIPHFLGEHWSSMLWQVRGEFPVGENHMSVFDRLVWESLSLLPSDATFYEAVRALHKACEVLGSLGETDRGSCQKKLVEVFAGRGFFASETVTDPALFPAPSAAAANCLYGESLSGCRSQFPLPPTPTAVPTANPGASAGGGSSGGVGCGDLAGAGRPQNGGLALLILPLCAAFAVRNRLPKTAAKSPRKGFRADERR